jgi:hypothetical protein
MEHQFFIRQQNLKLWSQSRGCVGSGGSGSWRAAGRGSSERTAAQKELMRLLSAWEAHQQIVFVTKLGLGINGSAVCDLGINAFAADDLDRPFAFGQLICDGINTDGGHVLAFRVSVDFSESDLLQFFVIAAQQLVATPSLAEARASNSQPAWWVQILGGHYNTAVRAPLPLQLRESEMFDLGSVPYKDSDDLCMACILSAHPLSVQKGSLRYPALFDFAAVLHNEMDVIAASNNHENGPQTGASLTYGGLSGPLQARAAWAH